MRLRTTVVALLVVLTVVLSGTVYAGFALHKDNVVESEETSVAETASTIANDLEHRLDSRRQMVRVGSTTASVADHGSPGQQAAVESFVARTDFDGATVVDRNGIVEAYDATDANASDREAVRGIDLGSRPYVRHALNGSTYQSEPFLADSGHYVVVVSTPIRNDSGIVGTLNAAFHLGSPDERSEPPFTDLSHVTGSTQTVLVRHGNETLYGAGSVDGETFTASADVDGTDWTVLVATERATIENQLREATYLQAGGVALVLLSFATIGYWTHRTTIRQLAQLREGFTAIEAGEYDVDVEISGTDEWDEIGDRFARVGGRLEQRERQLRVLNRVLRHNLRNDMNVVLGHTQSLTSDDADVAYHAGKIERAARETLETSQHARMIEDRLRNPDRVGEARAIDDVIAAAIEKSGVRDAATVTVDATVGSVVVDGDAIATALGEIVENAVEHNPRDRAERTIRVETTAIADGVRVSVTDNGPGLPDIERRLLEGEGETSPVEHGEGLGLWVARWLVERAGGSVSALVDDSGTTIHLDLPTTTDTAGKK
jgi:signal transduction histidine kinase